MSQAWDHLFLEASSPAVGQKAIEAASRKVKLPFPPEYVEFLLAHNGGCPEHSFRFPIAGCKRDTHGLLHVLYGVGSPDGNDLVEQHKEFRRRMSAGLLPIGCDLGGNQICLVCSGKRTGQVVFWEMAFEANTDAGENVGWGNVYLIADSLDDFLHSLEQDDG